MAGGVKAATAASAPGRLVPGCGRGLPGWASAVAARQGRPRRRRRGRAAEQQAHQVRAKAADRAGTGHEYCVVAASADRGAQHGQRRARTRGARGHGGAGSSSTRRVTRPGHRAAYR
jgi:hypothetical protein